MTSNLMTAAAELFALQETDLALDKALARLAEIEELSGETEEIITARHWLQVADERLKQLASTQKDLDFEAEEVRTHAAAVEGKLYGGGVTNPKELQDLDADLKSLKAHLQTKEDALLEHMEMTDQFEAYRAEIAIRLERLEAEWRDAQGHMAAEKERLMPEAVRLQSLRETEAAAVDRAVLSLYNLLRERLRGVAVAGVERGMCQGCRITLPTNVIQRARQSGAIVQCVSCERILAF
ncbi:MAG TPA: C4-type zinc ribbon domain-containing protein [Dehalococcoidia bacterium]|nr:C4-type zinc ribbon domain-containing protein [Dehalococcoidia bacterium]